MVERYVMAVDQGTTSTRCILFDHGGRLVAVTQREHKQYFPKPGWVEHDPVEIWRHLERIAPQALAQAGATPGEVVALGIANQRETTVLWDRHTGRPVSRAIVWQDTRTDALVDELSRGDEAQTVRKRSGLPPATYFSAPKVRWLLDHNPGLRERAERGDVLFGTMESWLIWNLTGGPDGGMHVTDVTNASRTLLMDLTTLDWDDELLAIFGVPRRMLPEIRPSTETYGVARGVLPGVRIAAALGDQQSALFGQTCFTPGEAKCTYGTGSFLLLNTGQELIRSTHGLLTTVGYKVGHEPPVYALEGSIAITGALVQWFRDGLGLIDTAAEIETLARSVDDNGGCYIVPAFSGLFAPHWRSEARGVIVGLTSYVTKGHMARAVLEATGWQTREVVDAMNADSGLALNALKVDGGMTADNLLMQFVADVLDIPVMRPMAIETVSLGAAYAAGLAVGYWPDLDVLRRNWHRAAQWLPSMDGERRKAEYENWRRAVERTFGWIKPVARLRHTSRRSGHVASRRWPPAFPVRSVGQTIRQPPSPDPLPRVRPRGKGRTHQVQYQFSRIVIGPVLHAFGRPKVTGIENIPSTGPAILASNHLSIVDSIYLPLVIRRPVVFPAKAEYFTAKGPLGRLWAAYLRSTNQLRIDRDGARSALATLQAALDLLRAGELFGFYPEGTRSPDGRLYRGRSGIGWLALKSGAPVIPVAMVGTRKMLPPGAPLPRPTRIEIRIGKRMEFGHLTGEPSARARRAVADEVMRAIGELSGQEYVHLYASDVKAKLSGQVAGA